MTHKNNILNRASKKPILWDAFYNATGIQKPLVIFCHGYKGFKDWGAWDLVGEAFAQADLFFVKFNFSHNGGTMEQPIDFPDLEAFAENNYSKELEDLEDLINFFRSTSNPFQAEIDPNKLILIGHSRGGGIVTIKATEDDRITKVITWASVSDFGKRTATSGELEQWQKDGVKYVLNGRTKQQMPHNYQFYEDFKANESRLNIEKAVKKLNIPHLIIHAKDDPSVAFSEAEALHSWNTKSILFPIENSDHVFGASHPWQPEVLPAPLEKVVQKSTAFIRP
ncbi:alpha/beta hydrolase family protein [Gelidibacter salicanalis]|uniref:Alpha/beta hydrolase n=1 Tax=Gelidibacter salicanalis TaxID=291193 RepID=A0A934KLR7_9FLAO|nr:alpha/beta hydrolase [Gelidibacter salicanalis]MBJ7879564.1 alpha/beta hydrolase [Gelidibacter salicanalis]